MKNNVNVPSRFMMIAAVAIVVSLSACKKTSEPVIANNNSAAEKTSVDNLETQMISPLKVPVEAGYYDIFFEDENMMPVTDDNTLLWNKNGHIPILAPDGHQLMLGEFKMASGFALLKCLPNGTGVVIHLRGLVPNGVYTVWNEVFQAPGWNGTFDYEIAEGALGAPDGSQNKLKVSPAGTANLAVILRAGPLSEFGSIGQCLSSEYQVHFAIAYHLDGQTHGGVPGDISTFVVPSVFSFYGSQL